ncbi:MAG: hypothetical protein IJE05_04150 [Clostridia bacterium]|nr:hypothetical protein [Clostridia bacterium]
MPSIYRCENKQLLEKKDYYENEKRGEKKSSPSKKKKIDFKACKKNTINSLNQVEHFLRNFNGFVKYIKLYKILK